MPTFPSEFYYNTKTRRWYQRTLERQNGVLVGVWAPRRPLQILKLLRYYESWEFTISELVRVGIDPDIITKPKATFAALPPST